ncbi:antirestriction protein ArdA [uncultured Desulfovibrio sp.]|uniref:antirestriction protein ArdA n=1 Tax=uncultured Desulfovibrio sp. TaxID=167968 RepID=UPI002615B911|nr:antirestriction protein ArdA [uncultured Desulfovibrio sp.]
MSEERRIYVASLTDYNSGILHGKWLTLDDFTDLEDLQEAVDNMLKESPIMKETGALAEECAIHDHEGFHGLIEEYSSLSDVWEIHALLEEHTDNENALIAYVNWVGGTLADAVNRFDACYEGEWESEEAFAENLLEDTGVLSSLPDWAQQYFDMKKYSRDLFMTDYVYTDGFVFRNY